MVYELQKKRKIINGTSRAMSGSGQFDLARLQTTKSWLRVESLKILFYEINNYQKLNAHKYQKIFIYVINFKFINYLYKFDAL